MVKGTLSPFDMLDIVCITPKDIYFLVTNRTFNRLFCHINLLFIN
jgi:hypothetical protein